jgi:hypothetical protein
VASITEAVIAARRRPALGLAAICVFVLGLGIWNNLRYPPGEGYDAVKHFAYADGLFPGLHLPQGTGEFYNPPGYYLVAGVLDWLAKELGVGDSHRAGAAVNILFLLGTVLLVWRIAQDLWPGKIRVAIGAAAFVALSAVTVKSEAMFLPEPLSMFLVTLALWCCVRTFSNPRYALALGVALGLAQLVRAVAICAAVAFILALLLGRRWREAAIAVCIAVLIPAPWYVRQTVKYGTPLPYNSKSPPTPIWKHQPLGFYVNPAIPRVVTEPYRPHETELFLPTIYDEMWSDYYGVWVWEGKGTPTTRVRDELRLQSLVGLLPTLLAIGGSVALLIASRRNPARLAVALLPLAGLLGLLYFAVKYPTDDGDAIKAIYMLTTTAGWALGFGYALEALRGRLWRVTMGLLAVCALLELPFLLFGTHWGFASLV